MSGFWKWFAMLVSAAILLTLGLYWMIMTDPDLGREACEDQGGVWNQGVEHCYR